MTVEILAEELQHEASTFRENRAATLAQEREEWIAAEIEERTADYTDKLTQGAKEEAAKGNYSFVLKIPMDTHDFYCMDGKAKEVREGVGLRLEDHFNDKGIRFAWTTYPIYENGNSFKSYVSEHPTQFINELSIDWYPKPSKNPLRRMANLILNRS